MKKDLTYCQTRHHEIMVELDQMDELKERENRAFTEAEVEKYEALMREDTRLNGIIEGSRGLGKYHVYLDLWRYQTNQPDTPAHTLAAKLQSRYPAVAIEEIYGDMAALRAIKSEAEIELMRSLTK